MAMAKLSDCAPRFWGLEFEVGFEGRTHENARERVAEIAMSSNMLDGVSRLEKKKK
jgi:hypothetical protein